MIETESFFQKHTKILVPAQSYDLKYDKRLIIPFMHKEKIGFVNNNGQIIVKPKYTMYYGECFSKNDYVKVTTMYIYGFPRKSNIISTYERPIYGLLNYKGEEILPLEYWQITSSLHTPTLFTVLKTDGNFGVVTSNGEIVVEYGKYDYIDGFDIHGLARVKLTITECDNSVKSKFGIINSRGNIVLPIEYDNIWNFYGKDYNSIIVEIDGHRKYISFNKLLMCKNNSYESMDSINYLETRRNRSYNEYEGYYAQDVAGYSDEDIDDAFDGEPDAYWNID